MVNNDDTTRYPKLEHGWPYTGIAEWHDENETTLTHNLKRPLFPRALDSDSLSLSDGTILANLD